MRSQKLRCSSLCALAALLLLGGSLQHLVLAPLHFFSVSACSAAALGLMPAWICNEHASASALASLSLSPPFFVAASPVSLSCPCNRAKKMYACREEFEQALHFDMDCTVAIADDSDSDSESVTLTSRVDTDRTNLIDVFDAYRDCLVSEGKTDDDDDCQQLSLSFQAEALERVCLCCLVSCFFFHNNKIL